VGTAFTAVHAARPALWHDLFHTDGFHPSPAGSYLEALVIYATIFGVLPLAAVSMPDDPATLWARARVMQPAGTPPLRLPTTEEMRYLRVVAASVCAVPAFDQPKTQTGPVAASPPSSVPQVAASDVQQDAEDAPLGAAGPEPGAAPGEQAKKDAEANLRAAMPFWLQTADPAKLGPAIEAAKKAGVAAQTVKMAEAKLTEAVSKAAKAAEEKERKEAEGAAKATAEAEAEAKAKVMTEARVKAEAEEDKFAAKQANAVLTAEAKVAARLKEMQDAENAEIRERREVESRLRAAMPFSLMTADPARLKPAIKAAKRAGVSAPIVAKAEAKLHEAEQKAERAATLKAAQGTETEVVEDAVDNIQVETRSQAQMPASSKAKAEGDVATSPQVLDTPKVTTAIQGAKAGAEAGEEAAAAAVGQQHGNDYAEDEPPKDPDFDPAETAAAERTLSAAMPFPLQLADPAQLKPAIEAAKQAGVAAPIVAKAEAKLRESLCRQADDELRAAMPYAWQTADPARLRPAIDAAKQAGVADLQVSAAEAKLKEAEEKPKRAAFDTYDRNHSGKLDHKELRKALASLGLNTDSDEAKELLAKYDEGQSGLVEFGEFQQLCDALTSLSLSDGTSRRPPASGVGTEKEKTELPAQTRAQAETGLRSAMPFPLMTADPARLKPAIEAAKRAGVSAPIVAKAEAKLHEAEQKAERAAMTAVAKPKLNSGASIFDPDNLTAKGDDAEGSAAVSAAAVVKPLQTAVPLPKESSRVQAAAWLAAAEADAASSPGCSTTSSIKGGVAPTTAENLAAAQDSKTAATLALEAVTAAASAAGRAAARVVEGPAEARFSATEAKIQAREENMSVAEATEAKAKAEADLQAVLAVLAQAKAATEAKAMAEVELKAVLQADAEAMSRQMAWAQARRDAEAQLQAAMPFLLQKADPAKLGPAIEAAKKAGVAAQTVKMAELKLTETLKKAARAAEEKELDEAERAAKAKAEAEDDAREEAEEDLRAAMPFPLMTADPARLKPAIEAAKRAGVWSPLVESAEAKLHEAELKAERGPPKPGSVEAFLAKPQALLTKTKMTRGPSIFDSGEGREEKMRDAERVQAKASDAEAKVAKADAEMPEHLLEFELRLDGALETFPKQAFQARLCAFLEVDEKAVHKLQLSAGSVVVEAVVAMPDGEALVAGRKRLEDADLETLSKRLDQQARPIPSRSRLALPCRAAACSPAPTPCCPAAHPGPT